MTRNALLALVLAAVSLPAHADDCRPLVPEIADSLAGTTTPNATSRWRAVERLWRESADAVQQDVEGTLKGGSLNPTADVIQGRLHDLLREAIVHDQRDLAHSLLAVWRKPLDILSNRDRVNAFYVRSDRRLSEVQLPAKHAMWVGPDGVESILYSAMYLAGATDIVKAISRRPFHSRSPDMVQFSRDIGALALDHYKRWAFGPPRIWQVRGWGCDAFGLDLVDFTRQRMDRSLGNGRLPYCVAPTDIDMLIAIGIANLLAIFDAAPEIVNVIESDRYRLSELLTLQSQFMTSRVVYGSALTSSGQFVETADFDPGSWILHPDLLYAGNASPHFPLLPAPSETKVGWDFSHGARIAWMALTLAEHASATDGDNKWGRFADALARQVAHRILDDDAAVPRFRNYMDGSNGWYRVNPLAGTGIPPFGLSRSFLSMPWARLSLRAPRLAEATAKMWKALAAPTVAQCGVLKEVYVDNSFWQDRKPAGAPISGPYYNLNLFPFLAVAPVR